MRFDLIPARGLPLWGFAITLIGHTTVGKTPLDELSARHRDLYLTTQHSPETNIYVPSGIRTHNPSKRAAADPHLRPRGQWDWLLKLCIAIL
jgi:hypothetical protein